VAIAEVVKAVGQKGECRIYPLLDWYPPLLTSQFLVWDTGERASVQGFRLAAKGPVVHFRSCCDRDQAKDLVGRRIGFLRDSYPDTAFPKPPTGLPFRFLGREVRLTNGEAVGWVSEVRRYGNQLTLVLQQASREVLIPAVAPILRPDDQISGPLTIDPPVGLLDVAGD
jgi:ribosomal 30S subunit maturation factor RimM